MVSLFFFSLPLPVPFSFLPPSLYSTPPKKKNPHSQQLFLVSVKNGFIITGFFFFNSLLNLVVFLMLIPFTRYIYIVLFIFTLLDLKQHNLFLCSKAGEP